MRAAPAAVGAPDGGRSREELVEVSLDPVS
jgi:hypothetical protein